MNDQSPPSQIRSVQPRSHNFGGGAAIGIDNQATEITTMSVAERTAVRLGVVGIPVSLGCEPCDAHVLIIESRLAGRAGMQMKTMLALAQTGEGWCDHKSVLTVSGQNGANRFADAVVGDAVDVNPQRTCLNLARHQQGDAESQQRSKQTHQKHSS